MAEFRADGMCSYLLFYVLCFVRGVLVWSAAFSISRLRSDTDFHRLQARQHRLS